MDHRDREEIDGALRRLRAARVSLGEELSENERLALARYELELTQEAPAASAIRRAFLELSDRVAQQLAPMPTLRRVR